MAGKEKMPLAAGEEAFKNEKDGRLISSAA